MKRVGVAGCCRMIVVWALLAGMAHANSYKVAAPEAWVKPSAVDLAAETPSKDISSGVYYLLLDRQLRKSSKRSRSIQDYRHQARRVVNQQGVEQRGSLSIDFDPAYQTLVVHKVVRHRDGKKSDLLKTAEVKLFQREE
ncbi:MAG: DUF3857 domain-containing protein [Desulfobacterales bacterium]|nr:DUF3857 domain-containing protein [Desulfobacterales bacterium]